MWVRFLQSIIVTFLVYFGSVSNSAAKIIEVKSENFVFYGDTSQSAAVDLIENLEAYRAILFSIYNMDPGPEYIPVKIYGFKSQKRLEKVTGRDNIGGLYRTTLEGPIFLLSTEGGLKRGKPARRTANHEFTHHILSSSTSKVYPRWYNEGMAEYLSTFEYKKNGTFKIGLPSQHRAYALSTIKWLPTDRLLLSIKDYPFRTQGGKNNDALQSIFYAQSWLVAHYIASQPGYSKKLSRYIDMINDGKLSGTSFQDVMGITTEEFDKEIKAYYKQNKYRYVSAKIKDGITVPKAQVREISKAEFKYHQGEAIRIMFDSEKSQNLAMEFFDEAAASLGETAEILWSRAQIAFERDDLTEAQALINKAYELDPNSRHIKRVKGILELEAVQRLGSSAGSKSDARKLLKSAMRAYPDDVTAHYYYAKSFLNGNEKPSKQAIGSARSALHYYRALEFLKSNLDMALVLDAAGQGEEALQVFERVAVWGPNLSVRSMAKNKMDQLKKP